MNKRFAVLSLVGIFLLQASGSISYAQEPYYKPAELRVTH